VKRFAKDPFAAAPQQRSNPRWDQHNGTICDRYGTIFFVLSCLYLMASFFVPPEPVPQSQSERFDKLVRPHVLPLYSAAYRLLGSREEAEDLVQDVLIKLYPRTDEMFALRDLRSWLLRVLYHQFVDRTRAHLRTVPTVSDDELMQTVPDPAPGPDLLTADADLSDKVAVVIGQLPYMHRALITLHIFGGHTLEELTEVFEVPVGTHKSRLHRSKTTLKERLAPLLGEWNPF
jgi:RNA polymerase sigma factor (sigma-70 family)